MLPHNDCCKEISQIKVQHFSLKLQIITNIQWTEMLKSPIVLLLSCQTLLLQFYTRELRAVFLWKRSEILPWYRCLWASPMPAISIITGSIWKAAKFMEIEQISHCSGHPCRSGLQHIPDPFRESCSAPVTPFIPSLPQFALKNSVSPKIWGPGTWNARSLFNINYFTRYVQENYFSTTQLWLCQN